ncbi:MAG: 3-isopropylmalate dehydrogenase [Gammaproteobacteria bacterium]|nr:3-isopropylmalate dehydrogenase [Gammaproteobacteria bacterium]
MTKKIAVLGGDGIGPDIVAEAIKVLNCLRDDYGFQFETEEALAGGIAYDKEGHPLPESTIKVCKAADAILLGAVGGPQYDALPRELRPESGLLGLRGTFELFANLRPAILYSELASASSLKPELVAGLDVMIVRELTGGIYFEQPKGSGKNKDGLREGFNTMRYNEQEVERIARVAFEIAQKRNKKLCSVDKANVLDVSQLWRDVVIEVSKDFPDVELSHMYVDNAAMQLVARPKQFDVIVTGNMFGDILSDIAAMLTGSIGMLPSASLASTGKGMYEPVHGSAPDIAGKGIANPLATILSVSMMLRYTFNEGELADRIEKAVGKVLANGKRSADIARQGEATIGTKAMGDAVVEALRS